MRWRQRLLWTGRALLAERETGDLKRELAALYHRLDYDGAAYDWLSPAERRQKYRRVAQLRNELRRRQAPKAEET